MSKLFKSFKKLKKADLQELTKRLEQINEYAYVYRALIAMKSIWLNQKIEELGLDTDKQYNVDLKSGRVIPIPEQPKPNPTPKETKPKKK